MAMKYIIFMLLLTSCHNVIQLHSGASEEDICQSECQGKYGTDLDFVGMLTGDCYCKPK
jgi:hypothetical protein